MFRALTKGYGSSWILRPCLTRANTLGRVQHPAFSLVKEVCRIGWLLLPQVESGVTKKRIREMGRAANPVDTTLGGPDDLLEGVASEVGQLAALALEIAPQRLGRL